MEVYTWEGYGPDEQAEDEDPATWTDVQRERYDYEGWRADHMGIHDVTDAESIDADRFFSALDAGWDDDDDGEDYVSDDYDDE